MIEMATKAMNPSADVYWWNCGVLFLSSASFCSSCYWIKETKCQLALLN
jgi:hypothetical protein